MSKMREGAREQTEWQNDFVTKANASSGQRKGDLEDYHLGLTRDIVCYSGHVRDDPGQGVCYQKIKTSAKGNYFSITDRLRVDYAAYYMACRAVYIPI